MPTGYTASIKDGIDFKTYALGCARAFGALILMRDEPNGTPIPDEFPPSPYHMNELEKAKLELAELEQLDEKGLQKLAQEEYDSALAYYHKGIADSNELQAKYEAMLVQAEAWEPPTKDHTGIKKFMISQIKESIKWDCGTDYYTLPVLKSAVAYKAEKLSSIARSIEYHTVEYEKEVKRSKERSAWVQDFKKSLA